MTQSPAPAIPPDCHITKIVHHAHSVEVQLKTPYGNIAVGLGATLDDATASAVDALSCYDYVPVKKRKVK